MKPEPPSAQPPEGPARIEDEAELATRARAGDRAAFGRLVERFAPQARRVARAVLQDPHDADDAAQDAFLAALVKLDQYDPRRPVRPWLMRIVANAATDRRRRRTVRQAGPPAPALTGGGPPPPREAQQNALGGRLRAAVPALPERRRLAVVLFDVVGQ